jgi:hypothetical protein
MAAADFLRNRLEQGGRIAREPGQEVSPSGRKDAHRGRDRAKRLLALRPSRGGAIGWTPKRHFAGRVTEANDRRHRPRGRQESLACLRPPGPRNWGRRQGRRVRGYYVRSTGVRVGSACVCFLLSRPALNSKSPTPEVACNAYARSSPDNLAVNGFADPQRSPTTRAPAS